MFIASSAMPPQKQNTAMQSITHFEIPCDDMDRVTGFYRDVFGWNSVTIPDMNYVMAYTTAVDETTQRPIERGAINGGFYKRNKNVSRSPVLVIEVDDIEKAIMAINKAGGTAAGDVHQVGDMGLYTQFTDSEDNVLGLWQSLYQGEGGGDEGD